MAESVPRLGFEDLEPRLKETLRPRVERLGYLGEFFRVTAHAPDPLRAFMEFTEGLKAFLPPALTEATALTVAVRTGSAYERHQHERLCLKLGFPHDWLRAVEALDPDADPDGPLGPGERAAQCYVLAALADFGRGPAVPAAFAALVDTVGHAHAVGVALTTGRYVTHAMIVNTFALEPPVPSPLDPVTEAAQ